MANRKESCVEAMMAGVHGCLRIQAALIYKPQLLNLVKIKAEASNQRNVANHLCQRLSPEKYKSLYTISGLSIQNNHISFLLPGNDPLCEKTCIPNRYSSSYRGRVWCRQYSGFTVCSQK